MLMMLAQTSQQFNWPKLVLLFIVVGFSVLSWIFKQLQQQRELRKKEIRRQQLEQESLRTGRPAARPTPGFDPESRQADEIAARRAEQLEAMRKKRAERARAGRPAQKTVRGTAGPATAGTGVDINLGGVILRIPGSTGPTVPGTRSGQPGPAKGRRPMTAEQAADLRRRQAQKRGFEAKRNAQAERARREQEEQLRRRAEAARRARDSEEGVSDEDPVRLLVRPDPDAPPPAPAKAALRVVQAALRGPGLKQALILREVLGPPISMRPDRPPGTGL